MNAIRLDKLRNAEILSFGKSAVEIIRLNDAVALFVKDETDTFETSLNAIDDLFLTSQKSSYTAEIENLDARRDRAIIGITKVIDGHTNHYKADKNQAAILLTDALKVYGTGIASLSYVAETTQLESLVKDLTTKPNLLTATQTLSIADWVTELDTANKAFNTTYIARTQELGSASNDTIKALRTTAVENYYSLRDLIDSYLIIKKKANPWLKTTNELNALIDQYNHLLASRKGSNTPPAPAPDAPQV